MGTCGEFVVIGVMVARVARVGPTLFYTTTALFPVPVFASRVRLVYIGAILATLTILTVAETVSPLSPLSPLGVLAWTTRQARLRPRPS